jgi:hypothetical protein
MFFAASRSRSMLAAFVLALGLVAGLQPPPAEAASITALGLVHAYRVTKDPDHLVAVVDAANALVAKQGAAPACDGDPGTGADRPFTVHVTFLMEASKTVKGSLSKTYRDAAKAWFKCVEQDFPDAADRADNRVDGRIGQGLTNLGEWDACLDVEAALAVGRKAYATAEALQIIARQPDWDVADPDCAGCELLGKGLCSEVMRKLGQGTAGAVSSWRADLLAAQDPADGSWSQDTQTTAYVLMGLDAQPKTTAIRNAINDGVLFLLSQAIGNGGYTVCDGCTDEITEIDSEVLQALYAIR